MKNYNSIVFSIGLFMMIFYPYIIRSQEWKEPVNIYSTSSYNHYPTMCIDNNNIFHCTWSHRITTNHYKIYYSKSTDNGETWSEPEDVCQNEQFWLTEPHIVSDNQNKLYLTYDHNAGNPAQMLVLMKIYDGTSWSESDTVSVNMPGSDHNRLVMDNNNRLYCFWFYGLIYYRYFENDVWSEINKPFTGSNELFYLQRCVADTYENLHCIGHHIDFEISDESRIIYFKNEAGVWSDFTQLSNDISGDSDIALDNTNLPHTVWKQNTSNTNPPNDGTFYSCFDGVNWYSPDLIVEDPNHQTIAIDNQNRVHIVDVEKFENGYRIVHYQKKNDDWEGIIVNENNYTFFDNSLFYFQNQLFLLYGRVDTVIGVSSQTSIILQACDLTTGIDEFGSSTFSEFSIFPNPFKNSATIRYNLNAPAQTSIKIYDLKGTLVNTLSDNHQPPGHYETIWNGKDQNGKEVKPGIYLVRLQAGRKVMTRSVEFIK